MGFCAIAVGLHSLCVQQLEAQPAVVLTGAGAPIYRIPYGSGSEDIISANINVSFSLKPVALTPVGNTLVADYCWGTGHVAYAVQATEYLNGRSRPPTGASSFQGSCNYTYKPGAFSIGIDASSGEVLYMHKEITARSNIPSGQDAPYRLHYYGKDKILRIWIRLGYPFQYAEDWEHYDVPALTSLDSLAVLDANPTYLNRVVLPLQSTDSAAKVSLTQATGLRRGAVADGVTRLLLRYRALTNGVVTFSKDTTFPGEMLSRIDSNDAAPVSVATEDIDGKRYAFALYTVPAQLANGETNHVVSFKAAFTPVVGTATEQTISLRLERPPVLLVHGLWDSELSWLNPSNGTYAKLGAAGFVVRLVNYKASNAAHLAYNAQVLLTAIKQAILDYRNRQVAISQVDVVAHSMGGLITRQLAQTPLFKNPENFNAGYIRLFVTIGTPHLGSELANVLWGVASSQGFGRYAPEIMRFLGHPIDEGAIEDLRVGSQALGGLTRTDIPSFALIGEASPSEEEAGREILGLAMSLLALGPLKFANPLLDFGSSLLFAKSIFKGQPNDLVVPTFSQKGGLDDGHTQTFEGVIHLPLFGPGLPGEMGSSAIGDKVVSLLSGDKSAFANGFPAVTDSMPSGLSTPGTRLIHLASAARQVVSPWVEILEPAEGATVVPGGSLRISVTPVSPKDVRAVLILLTDGDALQFAFLQTPPFTTNLVLGPTCFGDLKLGIFARDELGQISAEAVQRVLKVQTTATLRSILAEPPRVVFSSPNSSFQLSVLGEYSDGLWRDASGSGAGAGTSYSSSNTNVAVVNSDGVVTAVNNGTNVITASNQGFSAKVAITVHWEPPQLLSVYPQEFTTGSLNFPMTIQGFNLGGVTNMACWWNGRVDTNWVFADLSVSSDGMQLTANVTVMPNALEGTRQIVLTSPGGRSFTLVLGADMVLTYNAPCITDLQVSGSDAWVSFSAVAGRPYWVESKDSLTDTGLDWQTRSVLTNGTDGVVQMLDAGAAIAAASRFYRILTGSNREVISEPAGFSGITLKPGANALSVPLHRFAKARGLVGSVVGNTVTVNGTPGWTANALAPVNGLAQYVFIVVRDSLASPGIQGDWWTITGNTGDTLTLNSGSDYLPGLVPSASSLCIRKLTSLADLFGSGSNFSLNRDHDGSASTGDYSRADVIRFLAGTSFGPPIFYHDGTLLPEGWYQGSAGPLDGSTITLLPGQAFMLFRPTNAAPTSMFVKGEVQMGRLTQYLQPGPNVIGLPFASSVPIATSNLKESGWNLDRDGSAAAGDYSKADILRAITGVSFGPPIFYHDGTLMAAGWYSGGAFNNNFTFQPGQAYIFLIKGPNPLRWRQAPPY